MVTWNAEADARLLMAIIKTAKPKIDHEAVAKYMGMDVTAYAVQHRIRKLNAKAKFEASEANLPAKSVAESDNGAETTPTPSPRKRAPRATKPATPGRKRRAPAKDDVEDEDLPPKKMKTDADGDCA